MMSRFVLVSAAIRIAKPSLRDILSSTKQTKGKQQRAVTVPVRLPLAFATCETKKKVDFCFFCIIAKRKNLLKLSTKADTAFTQVGFGNWKKVLARFAKHEKVLPILKP